MDPLYSKEEFVKLPTEFKLGAIIADGMWYSQPKWRKFAKVSEEEIEQFIKQELELGNLIQSDNDDKSYRYSYEAIKNWHEKQRLSLDSQIIDTLFPAGERVWEWWDWEKKEGKKTLVQKGKTEVDFFLESPRRELGSVVFSCSSRPALEVIERLKGIARVRQDSPGEYRAYGLSAAYIKEIVEDVLKKYPRHSWTRIYARHIVRRREMADFPKDFREGVIVFYKKLGRSLIQNRMSTISMFLPAKEDQDAQIIEWIIEAIEKFDETVSVPFSGYLHVVLKHWPMNIPEKVLGKDLANFQNSKSKAITALEIKTERDNFTSEEIAEQMGMELADFQELEASYRVWSRVKNSTTLIWDESAEEKEGIDSIAPLSAGRQETDIMLANKLSLALITSALETENYADAFKIIEQIDNNDLNFTKIKSVSPEFIKELGYNLGMGV